MQLWLPPPHPTTHIFMFNISLFYFCYLYKLYHLSIPYLIWRVWCVNDNFVQMCWLFWQREVGLHKQENHTIKMFCSDFFLKKVILAKYIINIRTNNFKFKVHVHFKFLVHIQSENWFTAVLILTSGITIVFYCMCKSHVYNNNYMYW